MRVGAKKFNFLKICFFARKTLFFALAFKAKKWFPGRVVRHSSAKAATAVRIRWKPPDQSPCQPPLARAFSFLPLLVETVRATSLLRIDHFFTFVHPNRIVETLHGYISNLRLFQKPRRFQKYTRFNRGKSLICTPCIQHLCPTIFGRSLQFVRAIPVIGDRFQVIVPLL